MRLAWRDTVAAEKVGTQVPTDPSTKTRAKTVARVIVLEYNAGSQPWALVRALDG